MTREQASAVGNWNDWKLTASRLEKAAANARKERRKALWRVVRTYWKRYAHIIN